MRISLFTVSLFSQDSLLTHFGYRLWRMTTTKHTGCLYTFLCFAKFVSHFGRSLASCLGLTHLGFGFLAEGLVCTRCFPLNPGSYNLGGDFGIARCTNSMAVGTYHVAFVNFNHQFG